MHGGCVALRVSEYDGADGCYAVGKRRLCCWGRCWLRSCLPKLVVLLIGNLGAGKTTLAKGIVKGLGAADPEEVSSPTFTLIHEYGARVAHVDLYRLDRAEQVGGLAWMSCLSSGPWCWWSGASDFRN